MGVPAFFRWLSRKYEKCLLPTAEVSKEQLEQQLLAAENDALSIPNPNGIEFDCLYLDMNGIIHPCCHPEGRSAPETEDEMMLAVFEYIDRIVRIIRPRKLIYMAIDGVAPRAKMNQQRSRRFKAAKDMEEEEEATQQLRAEWAARGMKLPPAKSKQRWDHNVITPGTPFMHRLALFLQYHVYDKLHHDPLWKHLSIYLSDAQVPGEGEHKIVEFIREQRLHPGYNPNLRHVLYGLDADLIYLGLATHEPHFFILREDVFDQAEKAAKNTTGYTEAEKNKAGGGSICLNSGDPCADKAFILLVLSTLREYLFRELWIPHLPFPYDFERIIDDFVFLGFFVGNDFLPHLPSLDIRERALDRLIGLYVRMLPSLGGYLTDNGVVDRRKAERFCMELGVMEEEIFQNRKRGEARRERNRLERERHQRANRHNRFEDGSSAKTPAQIATAKAQAPVSLQANANAAKALRAKLMKKKDDTAANSADVDTTMENAEGTEGNDSNGADSAATNGNDESSNNVVELNAGEEVDSETADKYATELKDVLTAQRTVDPEKHPDRVRLGEFGWKERYYSNKFQLATSSEIEQLRMKIARDYMDGLQWVLAYYYQGCASWGWYYPFHYAPFAGDLYDVSRTEDSGFNKGTPFTPLQQLMSVLPARSSHCLPKALSDLMNDTTSPIADFYPKDFDLDLNGKKFSWQAVVLLPFIDESRLLNTIQPIESKRINNEEKIRNARGCTLLFVRKDENPIANEYSAKVSEEEGASQVLLRTEKCDGFSGAVTSTADVQWKDASGEEQPEGAEAGTDGTRPVSAVKRLPAIGETVPLPPFLHAHVQERASLLPIDGNKVYSFVFRLPQHTQHSCRLNAGVELVPPALGSSDPPPSNPFVSYRGPPPAPLPPLVPLPPLPEAQRMPPGGPGGRHPYESRNSRSVPPPPRQPYHVQSPNMYGRHMDRQHPRGRHGSPRGGYDQRSHHHQHHHHHHHHHHDDRRGHHYQSHDRDRQGRHHPYQSSGRRDYRDDSRSRHAPYDGNSSRSSSSRDSHGAPYSRQPTGGSHPYQVQQNAGNQQQFQIQSRPSQSQPPAGGNANNAPPRTGGSGQLFNPFDVLNQSTRKQYEDRQ